MRNVQGAILRRHENFQESGGDRRAILPQLRGRLDGAAALDFGLSALAG